MNEQELAYIDSFDPHEQEEFEKRIVRVFDAITGVPVMIPVKVITDTDLIACLTASIRANYDKQVLVIYVEKERIGSRWSE